MAVAAWSAGTAFSVGDIRRATTSQASGFWFECIVAGTSGGSEPKWPQSPFKIDSTVDASDPNSPEVVARCLITHNNQCVLAGVVADGTVTWKAISSTFGDLVASNPSAIIELFQLRFSSELHGSNEVYYFHAGTSELGKKNIIFDSQVYTRIPIAAEGFEYTNTGTLPRPTITISNLDSLITGLLLLVNATTAGNDLGGAEVIRIRTLAKYLDSDNFIADKLAITEAGDFLVTQGGDNLEFTDVVTNSTADPNARFPDERWFIDRKANETRDTVTFELASKFDLAGQKIPRRQIIANICQWKYKGLDGNCPYDPSTGPGKDIDGVNYRFFDARNEPVSTEAEDVCGKLVSSCKCRFGENGELPFGSFPGAGLSK